MPPLSRDLDRIRAALLKERGNITRAARALGYSKTWLMVLVRLHRYNAWAKQLRAQHGQPATGKPRTRAANA